jgi:hypothetical protein
MRKWGIIISAFYALILLVLLVPGGVLLFATPSAPADFLRGVEEVYGEWLLWVPLGILLISQALLLFFSVDMSEKRLKPRAHILVSCAAAGILTALLTSAVIWSLGFAIGGENIWDKLFAKQRDILFFWGILWGLWGVVFYLYLRNSSAVVNRLISWLLKGSILELLIVIPCHVIVRRRHDCSAPIASSFGIATGIAIMLLSFGPSVLFLYKKRLDAYPSRSST